LDGFFLCPGAGKGDGLIVLIDDRKLRESLVERQKLANLEFFRWRAAIIPFSGEGDDCNLGFTI
jgi:hypothetical protein